MKVRFLKKWLGFLEKSFEIFKMGKGGEFNLLLNAYQMILFPKKVLPPQLWGFVQKKSEFFKIWTL